MQRKEFSTSKGMRDWLRGATGVAIISVGFFASGEKLYTSMTSPLEVGAALEECRGRGMPDDAACFVEYEPSEDDSLPSDIDFGRYVSALVVEVRLASNGLWYGSHERLISRLENYEYLVSMKPPEPGFRLGFVMVKMPEDPQEVEYLRSILETEGGFMIMVPDGSGEAHIANTSFGRDPLKPA